MRIPLAAAAAWPPANHVNPEMLGPRNTVLLCILQTLVTALVAIRLYTRLRMSTGCRLDDVFIVLAYIPATGYAIGGIYQELVLKVDRHIWDFPIQNSVAAFKLSLAQLILFCTATTLTKLSMLALIYRITTAAGDRTARTLTGALALIVSLDGLIFIIVELTQCRPLSLYWTPSIRPQNCINEPVHLLAAGIINTVTDFIIVLLPVRTVFNLDLPRRQLVVVQALLAGGILATIAGAVRTNYTWEVFTAPDFDVTWRLHLVISLSAVELYVGIVCASLAATKPFFEHFIPRLLGPLGKMDVTEPLNLKKSRVSIDDGDSSLPRSSAGDITRTNASFKPSWMRKPTRGEGSAKGYRGSLATQLRFGWRPVISSPVISSPITPAFLVRDKKQNQRLQKQQQQLQQQPSIQRKPVQTPMPPWYYPDSGLAPIQSFSTATPRPAGAFTTSGAGDAGEQEGQPLHFRNSVAETVLSSAASSTTAVLPLSLAITTNNNTASAPSSPNMAVDLNKPLPVLGAAPYSLAGRRHSGSSSISKSSAAVEPLVLLRPPPTRTSNSRSRPLTTYSSSGRSTTTMMPRRSSVPLMPSSLIYEPSILAANNSSSSSTTQSRMGSVYDFMAYDDGHISVHKASSSSRPLPLDDAFAVPSPGGGSLPARDLN